MPLTLETGIKPGSPTTNLSHEDFVDQLDRVDPAQTPMSSFCSNSVELKSTDRSWLVDKFPNPKGAVGRAEGDAAPAATATTTRDWTANMRKVGNIGQGFDEQFGIGWIAQAIPKIAGVSDPLAYAKASAYLMLKQHLEVAFCSFDQAAIIDGGTGLGSLGAGYRKLTDASNAYTGLTNYAPGKPPSTIAAPTGASITGAVTSVLNRALFQSMAYALRVVSKRKGDWTCIFGLSLRQRVTQLTLPSTTSATSTATSSGLAPSQVMIYTRAEDDNVLGSSVDVVMTDFGRFMITDSDYIGTTKKSAANTAITNVDSAASARALSTYNNDPDAGLIVRKGNLFKVWGIPPFTEELGKDGGGQRFDAKCFAMLGVNNPSLGGWLSNTLT